MRLRSTRLTAIADAVRNKFYGAALNLRFDNTSVLDPRITFSRTSNATLTNSAGVLTYAPHNLLTFSEQFDNAAWTKSAATVSANALAAPNGTTTADVIRADATSAEHFCDQAFTTIAGNTYTVSASVKANGLTDVGLRLTVGSLWTGSVSPQVRFNLLDETTTTIGGTPSASSITALGDGWYRVSMSAVCISGGSPSARIHLMSGNNNVFTGNGTNGISAWGAQLNVGALQPYNPTTVKNLLGYTQEFDNAAWTKGDATVSTNTTVAPDGSVTADTITFGTNSTVPSQTVVITGGTPYTISFYVHASSTAPFVRIRASTAAGSVSAFYNVAAGVFGAMNAGFTPGLVVNEGNEWRRVSVQYVPLAPDGGARSMSVSATVADNSSTAATGSTLVLWGAQLSDSASLDPYVYNPVAAPASTAYYGPRFDYDPATLAPKGLLIEEQRTNSIRNNTMVGAVAGSPGTLPTNWAFIAGSTGISSQVIGTGVEAGVPYIDVRYSGTATSTSSFSQRFEVGNVIAALTGQTWAMSTWVKIQAGSTAGITAISHQYVENTSAGSFVTSGSILITVDSSLTRQTSSRTLTGGATVAFLSGGISVTLTNGAAIDITLRIGLPQLEQGAFATSPIPTTTAAATRAADVATMIGANFSSWYNQTTGTVYAEAALVSNSGNRVYLDVGPNGAFGTTAYIVQTSSAISLAPAAAPVNMASSVNTTNLNNKVAVALETNNAVLAANGALGTVDANCAMPVSATQLVIGNAVWSGGGTQLNGHIRRIAYYPRRLANPELQSITA